MKIITKTIIYYLLISLPLLFFSGVFSFLIIKSELTDNLNEILKREKLSIIKTIKSSKTPIKSQVSPDGLSRIEVINSKPKKSKYYDTQIYDKWEHEKVGYRVFESYFQFKNTVYKIKISKARIKEHELIESLFTAFIIILIFLTIGFLLANWLISKTLWKPFYKTLDKLNRFDVHTSQKLTFRTLKTKEFDQLNNALNKMTDKIYSDFIKQKEFNENASHEMQTPLAVIKANISLLMQSQNLKEEEMNQVQVIENNLKKLSALNKGLILLTKIENNQFRDNQKIYAIESINKIITNFQDSIMMKELKLCTNFNSEFVLNMNPTLADILFTNLIQNSIRHTLTGGEINIETTENTFLISNTGEKLKIDKEDLFKRFKKNEASAESLGLGLSIVKSIIDLYGFEISYNYKNNTHSFLVDFKI